ncbi:16S rRNA (guanine(527)-N(7))-methyltransferase RsmG [Lacticaseibacillus yichunensis]|uniref:Ribosomal RNA small subunit methyltransferase G n=1 Tax=Lacticaseibacillus yichunensis TaxID=2486015 RepID=A0ABW4CRC8_9LACO|nr:16S rRNA (guanine(527)-N(7))-methyltransferase RsmG [Lacticaseibacillus yichunensis]
MDPEQFKAALAAADWPHDPAQLAQFATYYRYLVAENEKMNLTALTAEADVYLKHFYDSLTLLQAAPDLKLADLALCDVGAGAGFPSLPVKILNPQLHVTIVDALQKRIDFLARLTEQLGVDGVQLVHARAEEFGAKTSGYRASFDVVTARAVAPLNVLAELCLPLVKIGGRFIAMKGSRAEREVDAAQTALDLLGGEVTAELDVTLPETGDARSLVVITKVAKTPGKYPRKPGTPAKQPLGGK